MRKCPNCGWKGETKFTLGQIIVLILLLCYFVIPGILYGLAHSRKCPRCGCGTTKIAEPKVKKEKNNGKN